MVFRKNRGLRLRPVNRIKHVVDKQGGLAVNTLVTETIIEASDTPDIANIDEVETGSTVNGIFLSVEVLATSQAALPNVYMSVWKNPGNALTMSSPNIIGGDPNKRFVIHQEMVMLSKSTDAVPRTLFKGVIVLPRGYRRFGPNDKLLLQLLSPGVTVDYCFQSHYKEFR